MLGDRAVVLRATLNQRVLMNSSDIRTAFSVTGCLNAIRGKWMQMRASRQDEIDLSHRFNGRLLLLSATTYPVQIKEIEWQNQWKFVGIK